MLICEIFNFMYYFFFNFKKLLDHDCVTCQINNIIFNLSIFIYNFDLI